MSGQTFAVICVRFNRLLIVSLKDIFSKDLFSTIFSVILYGIE